MTSHNLIGNRILSWRERPARVGKEQSLELITLRSKNQFVINLLFY